MSAQRKRSREASDQASSSGSGPSTKKRVVQRRTVEKWIAENDKAMNTASWLKFETAPPPDRDRVAVLKCAVCTQFKEKLESMRNFKPAFIEGTSNVRTSTFKEHATSDMHGRAMLLFKKARSSAVCEYAPIAKALAQTSMDATTRENIKRKFDIAYMIVKEKMAFTKMQPLCNLEERHGVKLGSGYKNDQACATFVEYIALEQRERLQDALGKCRFFSLQADGTTDAGNVEIELFLVLFFDPFSTDGMIQIRNSYFTLRHLESGTAQGLFASFKRAVEYMNMDDWRTQMIGFGCDGTNANMAAGGLRGLLESELPWVVVFWCLAHRLELAIKDALKNTYFSAIDELLLRMYYLYENSPKKCRELQDIVDELKQCFDPSVVPSEGGNRPLRACGTRFITHKVAALKRIIDRFGAYLSHLIAMIEDSTVKSVNKQKMKGYYLKWQDAQVILCCAFFYDLLQPSAILCKVLQEDQVCVVRAIESVSKTKKSLDKLKSTAVEELPNVKRVLTRITRADDGSVAYQGVELNAYERGLTYLKSHYVQWIDAVETCLRDRLKSQDTELLTHAVTLLATNGWEQAESASFGYAALDAVCERFSTPLESASVDCFVVKDEWDSMVEYGKKFLNLVQEDYKVIWWKLFNAIDSSQWSNVLAVIELLFCLPMANGRLERVFSQLKLIKTNRRTNLGEDSLDYLVRVNVEGPPPSEWDASRAFELWQHAKIRRVNRKDATSAAAATIIDDSVQHAPVDSISVGDWEEWIAD